MTGKYHELAPCGCLDSFSDQETDFIKEYQHWFLVLNIRQEFLGRSLLMLKAHKIDEAELSDEEALEKHHIYKAWRKAADSAFAPDKINQMQAGNDEALHHGHVHWHFIPRYRHPISFEGMTFFSDTPETQSKPIAVLDVKFTVPVSVRAKIRDIFLEHL